GCGLVQRSQRVLMLYGRLRKFQIVGGAPYGSTDEGELMADWKPLRARLDNVDTTLTLTWGELDGLVGGLPPSASSYAAFWSGERSAWAGFRTRDVTIGQSVTFVRLTEKVTSQDRPASQPVAMRSSPARSAVAATSAEVVLVGCVKEKLAWPAAAQDLYVSPLFQKER